MRVGGSGDEDCGDLLIAPYGLEAPGTLRAELMRRLPRGVGSDIVYAQQPRAPVPCEISCMDAADTAAPE